MSLMDHLRHVLGRDVSVEREQRESELRELRSESHRAEVRVDRAIAERDRVAAAVRNAVHAVRAGQPR